MGKSKSITGHMFLEEGSTEVAQRRTRRERLIKTIEDIGRHDIKNKLLDVYDQTHNDYNEER